jgi:hypothetical protein
MIYKPSEKSTFRYWFAHWKAFNKTAFKLKCWRPKYLLHDIEKPWLLLIWGDYERVRQFHRKHNKHHLTYKDPNKIDWQGMIIDWECSRLTKEDSQKTALEQYQYCITTKYRQGKISSEMVLLMKAQMPQVFTKLNLTK